MLQRSGVGGRNCEGAPRASGPRVTLPLTTTMDATRRSVIQRLLALSTFCTQRVQQLSYPGKISYNDYLDLFAAYKCCEEDADKALYQALHATRKSGHREDDPPSSQEEENQGSATQEEAGSEHGKADDGEEGDGPAGGSRRKAMVVVSAHDFGECNV